MLPLEKFKEIVASISVREETEEITSPGGSSRFGNMAMKGVVRKPVEKVPFIERLLMANGFAIEGHPRYPVEEVFRTDDPAISVSGSKGKEFRNYVSEEILTMDCGEHHTIVVELDKSGSELLGTSLFKTLHGERRLEDALVRIAHAALRGYEKQNAIDSKTGAQQHETLCVVGIRDDKKGDGEEAPYLVCFATKWADKYNSKNHSLVHFFLKQECVDWEPQLRDTYLTQIYERYFSKFTTDDWQRAFITSEEWKAASKVLDEFVENKGSESLRGALEDLLEQVASNFRLKESSGRRLIFTRENEHTLGVDPADLLKDNVENPIEATIVRDNEQHLLCYIMYCLDSVEEAASLRSKFENYNCFNNVLLIAPDEDGDLCVDVWDGNRSLRDKLVQAGSQQNPKARIISTISRFFVVSKNELNNPEELACELAYRARYLKQLAIHQLNKEREEGPLRELYNAFTTQLIQQSEEEFADAYAQTLSYGLLAARWMARDKNKRFSVADINEQLPSTSPFLVDLFTRLVAARNSNRLAWLIDDLARLLERTSVESVFDNEERDPVIHFYEDFLDEYDPDIKDKMGVYYTPDKIVHHIVESAHNTLIEKFDLPFGLADTTCWGDYAKKRDITIPAGVKPDDFVVQILDPATGTGTFLKHAIDVIYDAKMSEWVGLDWKADWVNNSLAQSKKWSVYVRKDLLPRLNGFEIMMAPYIVCHLRLGLILEQQGFSFDDGDRLNVFLTNTLELESPTQLEILGEHVAEESNEAERIKKNAPISVIIGNPPYDRITRANEDGSEVWVLGGKVPGRSNEKSLFDDILDVAREHTNFSHHASLYNLYVYFWRWALWKAFESQNRIGVVAFITANSWLRGPGFIGLRKLMRELGDEIQTLDLGGDNKGANQEANVFGNIETPVAITSISRFGITQLEKAATAVYEKVDDVSGDEKLDIVSKMPTDSVGAHQGWRSTSQDWMASLIPKTGGQSWLDMPALTDIFPWQQPGCKFGRLWPLAPHPEVLKKRWKKFVSASLEDRPVLFHTTSTGRNIETQVSDMDRLVDLPKNTSSEPIVRYGYRSFDRQWAFDDPRMAKTDSPSLWQAQSKYQLYLIAPITKNTSAGPILTSTIHVPDLDHFRGSFGGKDIIPLYRDAEAQKPNVTDGLLSALGTFYGRERISPEELAAYMYGILSCVDYQERFAKALKTPGPRVPISQDGSLWDEAVAVGERALWLHTYAERFRDDQRGKTIPIEKGISWVKPVSQMPKTVAEVGYDSENEILKVGDGRVAGIKQDVWEFSVSGMQVVKKWLGYRTRKGAGRAKNSKNPLDHIRMETWPDEWNIELLELLSVLTYTVEMQPKQADLLERICNGPLISASDLPKLAKAETKVPKTINRSERMKGEFTINKQLLLEFDEC